MTLKNKTFRSVTLGLQILAIVAYFIPSLFLGSAGLGWLALGVLHTALFAAVFFRDARTRTGISITLMILAIFWCLFMLLFGGMALLLGTMGFGWSLSPALFIYAFASLLAIIFALAGPRRYLQDSTPTETATD